MKIGKYLRTEQEFIINTRNVTLGSVGYDKRWKKWVFYPENDDLMFDSECLKDIAKYLDGLDETKDLGMTY